MACNSGLTSVLLSATLVVNRDQLRLGLGLETKNLNLDLDLQMKTCEHLCRGPYCS